MSSDNNVGQAPQVQARSLTSELDLLDGRIGGATELVEGIVSTLMIQFDSGDDGSTPQINVTSLDNKLNRISGQLDGMDFIIRRLEAILDEVRKV